jgi:hypothetical protein
MSTARFLFHVHSWHSTDGVVSPHRIISFCRQRSIHAVAITDHDSDAGLDKAIELGRASNVIVIPAVEYNSKEGDIVGLFCRGEMPRCSANQTVDEIQRRGGIFVLVHPAKGHRLQEIDVAKVDLIEAFNAQCDDAADQMAQTLAQDFEKPVLAGADAHLYWDLDSCENELDVPEGTASLRTLRDAILRGPRPIVHRRSPSVSVPLSQMVKACRERRPKLFLQQALSLAVRSARSVFPRQA